MRQGHQNPAIRIVAEPLTVHRQSAAQIGVVHRALQIGCDQVVNAGAGQCVDLRQGHGVVLSSGVSAVWVQFTG